MRLDRTLVSIDLYEVLGVSRTAPPSVIRRAYRRLVTLSHPDLHKEEDAAAAERRMARINVAAGVLLDRGLRAAYDERRAAWLRGERPKPDVGQPADRSGWWWTRSSAGSDDWATPRRASRPRWSGLRGEHLELLRRFRPASARGLYAFEAWSNGWSPRQHATFLVATLCLAVLLIGWARPTSLHGQKKPASTHYVMVDSPD